MPPPICRWGILGAANIAQKNWKAIRRAGNAVLTVVASRSVAKAEAFIVACQADTPFPNSPAACGSYEELLRRDDVDAVYIPLPTGIRPEWVVKAAEAGKHVLCEKPCGPTAAEVQVMLEACRKNGVQFMDGVMFMHSARMPLLRRVLDDGVSIGEIRRITSQFSFKAPEAFFTQNIRVSNDLEPLGCLGDLGWYNARFSLWTMNFAMPERVIGHLLEEYGPKGQGVPVEFSGEFFFKGGVTASFYCSFRAHNHQWANISGSKGYLQVPDFVVPFYGCESIFEVNQPHLTVEQCSFNMESHPVRYAVREYSEGWTDSQETNMIRKFSELVLSGQIDPSWGEISLKTQMVLEACLKSARNGGREETSAT